MTSTRPHLRPRPITPLRPTAAIDDLAPPGQATRRRQRDAQSAACALALATALDFGALAWLGAHPGLSHVLLAAALARLARWRW